MKRLSYSALSAFKKSPNHLLAYWERDFVSSAAQAKGSLIHTLVLEPEKYDTDYAVYEGKVRRGKEWEAFKAVNSDKTIINTNEYFEARKIADKVLESDLALDLLMRTTETEQHVEWEYGGLGFHGFIDGVGEDDFIFDLKTCQCSEPSKFSKDAFNYGYYLQAAMYLQATKKKDYYIIAAETQAPYNVQVYKLTQDLIDYGLNQYKMLVDEFVTWNGEQIGYSQTVEELDLPNWLKNNSF